jgi:glutaredoxin/predicted RNA-binding Zn-ribbon protein involved in translation (DUF1610 family)
MSLYWRFNASALAQVLGTYRLTMTTPITTCPSCRYSRQATDHAPAWQCPNCGVAYSKVLDQPYVAPVRAYSASSRVERRGGWGRWLFLCFLVFGAYLGITHPWRGDTRAVVISDANAQQPEVSLYATSWCPYCAKTREYFRMHGVRYTEYDIEHNAAAEKGYRRLHGNGVPVVVVGDQVIHGYDPGAMADALRPWLQ